MIILKSKSIAGVYSLALLLLLSCKSAQQPYADKPVSTARNVHSLDSSSIPTAPTAPTSNLPVTPAPGAASPSSVPPKNTATFLNPIVGGGADPWVVFKDGFYYYCTANGNNAIFVAKSASLLDIGKAPATRVWLAPPGTDHSGGHWAAELHFLDGKWYIYYAASNGDNASHRMFVLESQTSDPQGAFTFKGKIAAPTDRWAIDGTVMVTDAGKKYFVWSGWDSTVDYQQNLYIQPMINPWTLQSTTQATLHLEAEAARLNQVSVRDAEQASGGRAVSKIDIVDSSIEFNFTVPVAGDYQIDARYSNGTDATSTHHLFVNGSAAGDVAYKPVGWENFQTAQAFVTLKAGAVSLRFAKGTGFAEIDSIEVKPKGTDRVVLSMPEFDYEKRSGPSYVNEGPEVLNKNGLIHIIYSGSGSWSDDYNLIQLTYTKGDILDQKNWEKKGSVFARTDDVFGPGHASFTKSPDGTEDWIVYHAAKAKGSGWDRNVRTQPFTWDKVGNPVFGTPTSPKTPITVPSGTR